MNILVSGSSGLIGSALVPFLTAAGHRVLRLVRAPKTGNEASIQWNPETGSLDATALEELDGVIHLAGENIAGLWSPAKKRSILESRVRPTQLLCSSLASCQRRPQVIVCASALGYYGDRGSESVSEESPPGTGSLAEVCKAWEAAAEPARASGIRVVSLRIGPVLTSTGGMLERIMIPFRLGIGGKLGSGRQYMSWISLDDLLGAILHAVTTESLIGPVNAVTPYPISNLEFTRTLARLLGRPSFLSIPAFALRLALGELADSMLLVSIRAEPARLLRAGYRFSYPTLEEALRHALGRI